MKLTEEQMDECVKEYRAGDSLETLSKRYGVSRVTMTRYLAERTTIRKPGARKGVPRKPKELGPEWKLLGKIPDAELAKRIGCARQNVSRIRQVRGIPSSRDLEIFNRMKGLKK
jgi:transcriptional regulator with XRE-family HTH domain